MSSKRTRTAGGRAADGALCLNLFNQLLPEPSWDTWRVIVKALFGLPLDEQAAAVFRQLTGRQTLPTQRVNEAWITAGRRSGKTRAASALAVWAATIPSYRLAPGEKGVVLLLGADRRQAGIAKSYIAAMLRSVPQLAELIVTETKEAIELLVHGHTIMIEVGTSSYRLIRGRTVVCAILDELCFWPSDEQSAEPDKEALVALRPALATTGGLLLALSSPHRQTGSMYQAFQQLYGNDARPDALFIKAPTRVLNALIPESLIDQARADDPSAAASEWDAEWRADLEDFLSPAALQAVVVAGRHEYPPVLGVHYTAFADPSGGSSDSFTLGVAHRDAAGLPVLDLIRERKPPFSPEQVVNEFCRDLARYNVRTVIGDAYAGAWVPEAFKRHGIAYEQSALTRSMLYLELLPLVNGASVQLLDNARLLGQLAGLERRVGRSGRDSVDHRPGAHDDVANAAAGALICALLSDAHATLPADFNMCYRAASIRSFDMMTCFLLGGRYRPTLDTCCKGCKGHTFVRAARAAHEERNGEHVDLLQFYRERIAPNEFVSRVRANAWANAMGI